MNSLSFLIPFVFPGVFIRMVYDRFFPSIQEDKSKYNEMVQSFIISTVIWFINGIIIMMLYGINIMSWNSFREYIVIPINFIVFFSITFILSLVGVPVYRWIINVATIKVINIMRKNKSMALESAHLSPWHAVFENKDFSLKNRPIGIFKGNELITIGYVYHPAADKKTKEFKITSTDFIKGLYLADLDKSNEDKLFDLTDAEYYDPQLDMLIKFYNNENYLKYLEDNNIIS